MTMTRWFTDFIYTPLAAAMMRRSLRGGYSTAARLLVVLCLPVIVTFLLVGLWHGAGWGFVIWGAIQGAAMTVNLIWREARLRMPGVIGWVLMMVTFVSSLAFFRAPDVATATGIVRSMFGFGLAGPPVAQFYGTTELFATVTVIPALWWVIGLLAIALVFPNSQEILGDYEVGLMTIPSPVRPFRLRLTWKPGLRWALTFAMVAAIGLVSAGGPSPFLYYNF
jgi:alginate O-acetyltransferase complex protein AlgI